MAESGKHKLDSTKEGKYFGSTCREALLPKHCIPPPCNLSLGVTVICVYSTLKFIPVCQWEELDVAVMLSESQLGYIPTSPQHYGEQEQLMIRPTASYSQSDWKSDVSSARAHCFIDIVIIDSTCWALLHKSVQVLCTDAKKSCLFLEVGHPLKGD